MQPCSSSANEPEEEKSAKPRGPAGRFAPAFLQQTLLRSGTSAPCTVPFPPGTVVPGAASSGTVVHFASESGTVLQCRVTLKFTRQASRAEDKCRCQAPPAGLLMGHSSNRPRVICSWPGGGESGRISCSVQGPEVGHLYAVIPVFQVYFGDSGRGSLCLSPKALCPATLPMLTTRSAGEHSALHSSG